MMASNVFQVCVLFRKLLDGTSQYVVGGVRHASKKMGAGTGRVSSNSKPKHYGWWKQDGSWVSRGTILARQYTLRFCPGLNVGFSARSGYLYAKVAGRVVVTCETTDFNDHSRVLQYYPNTRVISKKYFNVIPEPQHQRFKLVDTN